VQLSLPLSGVAASPAGAVVFVRHRRARRYIIRVLADGTVRVTLPRWGLKRDAVAFVDASRAWIADQMARRTVVTPRDTWGHGTPILIDGAEHALRVEQRGDVMRISCENTLVAAIVAPHSPAIDVREVVSRWLYDRGRRELPVRLLELAAAHGISVTRVSVRDQRSRWGACSPTGTITLNWRLIQTPAFVRDYVLLHELMHRRELNHSRRFWKLVAAACPRHADARRWLRKEGKRLWAEGE
jgi:predicted metal-dependent hydrolase